MNKTNKPREYGLEVAGVGIMLAWNWKVRGYELPLSALIGLTASAAIWVTIMVTQPVSRWVGITWMIIGLTIFYLFRRKRNSTPP